MLTLMYNTDTHQKQAQKIPKLFKGVMFKYIIWTSLDL